VDPLDELRRLALSDPETTEALEAGFAPTALDPGTVALARLAALIAVGGAGPSYGLEVTAAIGAGATVEDLVELVQVIVPVVGLPKAVSAAPRLAAALGYEFEETLET
jgi:4-carboxymuconolactone decarboxylase